MIAKGVYVGECVFNRLVSRLRKRWIDSINDCLEKKKKKRFCMKGLNGGDLCDVMIEAYSGG